MSKKVTISLVVHNGAKFLPECLKCIEEQTYRNFDLYIVDNNSTDNSIAIIKKRFPECKIIAQKQNLGFGKAHNLIIDEANSEYILILNQDVFLDKNYLETCVEFMINSPDVGSVSGKILKIYWKNKELTEWEKSDKIDSCGLTIKKSHAASNYLSGSLSGSYLKSKEVFGLSATAALYRKEALEDVAIDTAIKYEYFDEDFFMYQEDIDLAYRLRWNGWKTYCLAETLAYHFRTRSDASVRQNNAINIWSYRNHLSLLIKNIDGDIFYRCFAWIIFYELAKFIYIFLFEHMTVRGLTQFIEIYKKMKGKHLQIMQKRKVSYKEIMRWLQA
jgi:GT2 family glycosyltransferase